MELQPSGVECSSVSLGGDGPHRLRVIEAQHLAVWNRGDCRRNTQPRAVAGLLGNEVLYESRVHDRLDVLAADIASPVKMTPR